jgi:hypothetical protein
MTTLNANETEKSVEEIYREYIRSMSGTERGYRAFVLFQSFYEMLAYRIKKEQPEIGERALRIALAKRLYGNDPRTMELIRMCEERETDYNT